MKILIKNFLKMAKNRFPRDFLPTCHMFQGSMFPILPELCSCGRQIGCYQREIASSIGIKLEKIKKETPQLSYCQTLANSRIETFKNVEPFMKIEKFKSDKNFNNKELLEIETFVDMGFTRDCCLLSLTTYPFLTVNDIEGIDAFVDYTKDSFIGKTDDGDDEGNIQISENNYIPYVIPDYVGAEFYPFTKGKFGFDPENYCKHLYELTLRTSTRYLPFDQIGTIPTIPRFPNLGATREPYPILVLNQSLS